MGEAGILVKRIYGIVLNKPSILPGTARKSLSELIA
jgi:hypothetical protein